MIKYSVYSKEIFYYSLMLLIGICFYLLILPLIILGVVDEQQFNMGEVVKGFCMGFLWLMVVLLVKWIIAAMFKGHLIGNSVQVNADQFPDIHNILARQSNLLELSQVPDMYILNGGGVLNAFACRVHRKNYVILYSEVVEAALENGMDVLAFVIGHELGHIKRKHVHGWFKLIALPSYLIPFLHKAYSRACEYTCDRIAFALATTGGSKGLALLSVGSVLSDKVDATEMIIQYEKDKGLSTWIAEICSTHPHLVKRMRALLHLNTA